MIDSLTDGFKSFANTLGTTGEIDNKTLTAYTTDGTGNISQGCVDPPGGAHRFRKSG
jgi:hypothetical protein